jgi:hypothetical protein
LAVIATTAASWAYAQTPPAEDTTAPSAASSPSQRAATSSNSTEAPTQNGTDPSAASTPHQQQATGAMSGDSKSKHAQMMKDCIAREQAKNADQTQAQVKKTCAEQMKSTK